MTKKYTTPEEDTKIKELYRSGKYSYDQIGKIYHVSKPTIINIVTGYPWSGSKAEFWQRVYRGMSVNMDSVLKEIRSEILDCLIKHDNVTYSVLMRQEEYLLSYTGILPEELFQRLRQERVDIEQTAWGHFSKKDYSEFAYFQSLWHKVSNIIGDNHKNPFGKLPDKVGAKSRANSIKYYSNKEFRDIRHYCRNVTKNGLKISDNLYDTLKYSIIAPGRAYKNPRKRLNDILDLFVSGKSPKQYPDWRKIYDSYTTWYRSGVFRLIWEIHEEYQELEPIQPALLYIERHRLIDTERPPRFKDVQDANRREKNEND